MAFRIQDFAQDDPIRLYIQKNFGKTVNANSRVVFTNPDNGNKKVGDIKGDNKFSMYIEGADVVIVVNSQAKTIEAYQLKTVHTVSAGPHQLEYIAAQKRQAISLPQWAKKGDASVPEQLAKVTTDIQNAAKSALDANISQGLVKFLQNPQDKDATILYRMARSKHPLAGFILDLIQSMRSADVSKLKEIANRLGRVPKTA